jgi:hypothetical protein
MRWDTPGRFWDEPGLTYDSEITPPQSKIPMAFDQTRRLRPAVVQQDIDTLSAIKTLTPTYAPSDVRYAVATLNTAQTSMGTAQGVEVTKKGEFEAARDAANAAEWALHNLILGAKDQVIAQYGEDSDQVQAIGLKKKSEHKRPGSHTPTPTPPPAP